jgi:hypothetical protein
MNNEYSDVGRALLSAGPLRSGIPPGCVMFCVHHQGIASNRLLSMYICCRHVVTKANASRIPASLHTKCTNLRPSPCAKNKRRNRTNANGRMHPLIP